MLFLLPHLLLTNVSFFNKNELTGLGPKTMQSEHMQSESMRSKHMQIVEISIPSLENHGVKLPLTYAIMEVPVLPDDSSTLIYSDGSITLIDNDGNTTWTPHCIYRISKEGVWYTWYQKPTLAEAIKPSNDASYYEFRQDGSVIYRYRDIRNTLVELWWSH